MIRVHPLRSEATAYAGDPLDPYFVLEATSDTGATEYGNGFMLAMWPEMIVTAAHVVFDAAHVRVWTRANDEPRILDCISMAHDDKLRPDLALLRLPTAVALSIKLDVSAAPPQGEGTLCAYPNREAWERKGLLYPKTNLATKGRWIFYRDKSNRPLIHGEPGASGGALFSEKTEKVIGVHHGYFNVTRTRIEHAASVCDLNFLLQCRSRLET